MTSFYKNDELPGLGFRSIGKDVLISRKASFYGPEDIVIGEKVRIDDFCILSGRIHIGSHVHVSAYTALYGQEGITIDDYSGLSPRCTVFSAMDDFSGEHLIGPMVVQNARNVSGGRVHIRRYSQVGAGCVVFPNLNIEEGVVVGAMSLVNKTLQAWGIYAGIPARFIRRRSKDLLKFV